MLFRAGLAFAAACPSANASLDELAEIFGCGMEELLTDASDREVDQARKILELLEGLSNEKREVLIGVIRQRVSGPLSSRRLARGLVVKLTNIPTSSGRCWAR